MVGKQTIKNTTPAALMADLEAAQKEMDDNEKLIEKYTAEQDKMYRLKTNRINQRDKLKRKLAKAKREAANLKKFIWTSDNPNIVELRDQLLMAAKLIKE